MLYAFSESFMLKLLRGFQRAHEAAWPIKVTKTNKNIIKLPYSAMAIEHQ